MYVDDLLLYVRRTDSARDLSLLESAMDSLTPWLDNLGLSISNPKCQMCVLEGLAVVWAMFLSQLLILSYTTVYMSYIIYEPL